MTSYAGFEQPFASQPVGFKGGKKYFRREEKIGPGHGIGRVSLVPGRLDCKHAREMMAFYAPTINSYKRYQSGSWAPTSLAWSFDNRTAGFRVVGHGKSLRIECRIPGADVNPYLAYAAALASGLDGIRNKIEPPDIFEGRCVCCARICRKFRARCAMRLAHWNQRLCPRGVR